MEQERADDDEANCAVPKERSCTIAEIKVEIVTLACIIKRPKADLYYHESYNHTGREAKLFSNERRKFRKEVTKLHADGGRM